MENQLYYQRYVNYYGLQDQKIWTFLSPNEKMRLIDTHVVQQALSSGESADEVKQIVFHGSNYCQTLDSISDRIIYVSEVFQEVGGHYC